MTSAAKSAPRQFQSFITGFLEHTELLPTSLLYRKWAAIGCIASALGRRTWWRLNKQTDPLHPNMFLFVVGRPASGKSQALDMAHALLSAAGATHLAPDSITKEFLIRRMAESMEAVDFGLGLPYMQSNFTIVNSEIGNFIPRQDHLFMRYLARLYDCPPTFQYETKHQSGEDGTKDHVENPCLNILGGVQPVWIKEALPQEAFETGLPSRMVMIYQNERTHIDVALEEPEGDDFGPSNNLGPLYKRLVIDLRAIGKMKGRFVMTPDARMMLQDFINLKRTPEPTHPKLETYNLRRWMHLAKLSMIVSAAQRSDRTIGVADMLLAEDLLQEAEVSMAGALSWAGDNPLRPQMDFALSIIESNWANGRKWTPVHIVQRALWDELHPAMWRFVLDALTQTKVVFELDGAMRPTE